MILLLGILAGWIALGLFACAVGLPAFYKRRFAKHDDWVKEGRRRLR